jgi:hypothetical protein
MKPLMDPKVPGVPGVPRVPRVVSGAVEELHSIKINNS